MSIELVEVTIQEKHILENMLHFYLNDLTKFTHQLSANKEGIFEYERLNFFFNKPNLTPFFIKVENQIIGYLLFEKLTVNSTADYRIHSFFILKQYRKMGLGTQSIHHLTTLYPGTYSVVQIGKDHVANAFWKSFFQKYGLTYKEELIIDSGENCILRTFTV